MTDASIRVFLLDDHEIVRRGIAEVRAQKRRSQSPQTP